MSMNSIVKILLFPIMLANPLCSFSQSSTLNFKCQVEGSKSYISSGSIPSEKIAGKVSLTLEVDRGRLLMFAIQGAPDLRMTGIVGKVSAEVPEGFDLSNGSVYSYESNGVTPEGGTRRIFTIDRRSLQINVEKWLVIVKSGMITTSYSGDCELLDKLKF